MRLRKRVKKKIYRFILFIFGFGFLSVLVFSAYKILAWKNENNKADEIKEMINNYVTIDEEDDDNTYHVDFDKLKEFNDDIVAYLKVFNTKIEYPVVQTSDNDYYLTHSLDKKGSSAGWVFANYHNSFDGSDKNISLFGHGRLDGSMFGTLKDTLTSEWQNKNTSRQIVLVTEDEVSYYEVFSTYKILIEDYYINNNFTSDEEYQDFLDTILERSNHDYGVELNSDDQILTLSTCDIKNNYRVVLHAKKIKETIA